MTSIPSPHAGSAPAIDVRSVRVTYGDTIALNDATLTVTAGCVTGLVGMNGAGKSTLFNALLGAVPLAEGHITIAGSTPDQARKNGIIAYVPQTEHVDWSFPIAVRDVVAMGRFTHLGPTRRLKARDREEVSAALERAGLTDLAHRQIGQLSGGQRKRAFVARAIAQQAPIMLLDEPFAGVDKRTERALTEVLKGLAAEGRTVLVSTHDLAALPELADEVLLLHRTVIARGKPADVLTPEVLAQTFGLGVGEETPHA